MNKHLKQEEERQRAMKHWAKSPGIIQVLDRDPIIGSTSTEWCGMREIGCNFKCIRALGGGSIGEPFIDIEILHGA